MKIYTGIFTNSQVNYWDNSGNEQDIFVKIVKQPLYHMAYTYYAFGGGDLHFTFTFQGLPATATGIVISHSGDLFTWTNVGPFSPDSPIEFDLSNGTYNFIVYVQRSDGSDVISFVEENISLDLADNPLAGRVVDTDEDKFTPIRSRAYEVRLHTSTDIDIMTFADGGDNDYLATISVGDIDNIIFTGWLSIADLRQEFQPHPNILVLTITDGLGFLRDTPLNDSVGVDFTGENKLIEYIAGALCKTGLQLPIVVENNIRESTAPLTLAGHFYNHEYLNCLTFEKEIGTFQDCYTALEYILGENCELSQQKNKWFIKRVDEFCELQNKQTEFTYAGVISSDLALTNYFKNIGSDNTLHTLAFMNDDAELSLQRPYLNVRHDYKFDQPLEVPCNSDFSRGDLISETNPLDKTYEVFCWTLREGVPGYYGTVDGTTATIHRIYNADDYETDRYVVLTPRTTFETSTINDVTYIESEPIPLEEKDKFTVSIEWRLNLGIASGTNGSTRLMRCILKGDDGSYWILGEDTTGDGIHKWFNTSLFTVDTAKGVVSLNFTTEDEEEWRTIEWNGPPVPVTGKLYIWLNQFNQLNSSDDDKEVWYNNLSFTYIPLIGSSYRKYTGQYHKSEQDTADKAVREKQVYISDSPKKLYKGCLLKLVDGEFVKTEGFFDFLRYPGGATADNTFPYGQIQNNDVWNQHRRVFTVFEGTIDGLDTDTEDALLRCDIPDLIHTFFIYDSHAATNHKRFKLLSYVQDYDLCEWDLNLVEVHDVNKAKDFSGHTFKYLEND